MVVTQMINLMCTVSLLTELLEPDWCVSVDRWAGKGKMSICYILLSLL